MCVCANTMRKPNAKRWAPAHTYFFYCLLNIIWEEILLLYKRAQHAVFLGLAHKFYNINQFAYYLNYYINKEIEHMYHNPIKVIIIWYWCGAHGFDFYSPLFLPALSPYIPFVICSSLSLCVVFSQFIYIIALIVVEFCSFHLTVSITVNCTIYSCYITFNLFISVVSIYCLFYVLPAIVLKWQYFLLRRSKWKTFFQ